MTIGVAIALYNGARFVEQQLDTIRLQTRKPDRVVLCDDGSGDDTVFVVRKYLEKHGLEQTWQLHENPENLGYIRNFYRAISLCDTDLVFLSDQDDVWKPDKLEKMTLVMEQNPAITLLSCGYGIINAQGEEQHSLVEPDAQEDEALKPISVQDIMTAYRWPGMLMCLRRSFFTELLPSIENCGTAHDLMFAVCAADRGAFYEYHYIGAYHRRHDNNAAREEHRVFKLLNLERKLTDIAVTKKLWSELLSAPISIRGENRELIQTRLSLLQKRERALREKSLKQVLRIYREDGGKLLRKASLICDVWLAVFGKLPK